MTDRPFRILEGQSEKETTAITMRSIREILDEAEAQGNPAPLTRTSEVPAAQAQPASASPGLQPVTEPLSAAANGTSPDEAAGHAAAKPASLPARIRMRLFGAPGR